ncbi:MAG: diaminopropionate ammonia-lyase [Clostridia bacterium]|nr:diaminopropionate ammonia-lyase [Clostridia bacterium]
MIRCLKNADRKPIQVEGFDLKTAASVRAFHETMPSYAPTALRELPALAAHLGISGMLVKDESTRFGLQAFKALGGTYCVASCLARILGMKEGWGYADLLKMQGPKPVFATATDGNHGRGIAYASRIFGCACHVYLPKGSADERVEHIRQEGAVTTVTDFGYDETVRLISDRAKASGWFLVQDTAWEGYTDIPKLIMQGYLTMGEEIREQARRKPTHIFLQAGVGSMAASLCAYFRALYGEETVICVVEARAADCLYETARAHDGKLHWATGDMQTMMAGLCCGYPCLTAWDILSCQADYFMTLDDEAAALGMCVLAKPYGSDPVIESGESGASTTGLVCEMLQSFPETREELGIGDDAVILCISTEGATDRENYERMVRG